MSVTARLLILMLLLGTGGNAAAQQWYQVELILFEHINPGFDGEDMYRDPGLVPLNGTVRPAIIPPAPPEPPATTVIDTPPAPKPLIPFSLLPETDHRLAGVYQTLRRAPDYRPHYHVAWLQPAQDGSRARALHLQQEDSGSVFELTMPPLLVTDPMPTEFYEPVKLLLDGTVRIRVASQMLIDLDMVLFRSPAADIILPPNLPAQQEIAASITEKPAEYMRLTETRRVRLNDLAYFDHPKFGVIMQVTRYEPTPVTEAEPATTPSPTQATPTPGT